MISTSDSDWLVRAKDLSLHFDLRLRPRTSWREVFVEKGQWGWRRRAREITRIHAIQEASFEIRRGDRVGIVGKNGSGKTSLCRCISGIYEPRKGRVERRGESRSVFGAFPMIEPELSGRENARLLSSLFFSKIPRRSALLEEALAFSELGSLLDMPVKFYSTGMNARLVLSLVSAAPCELLILDEVFDGADVFFRKKIGERMRTLIRSSGAVLFVSHSFVQLRELCNRLWVYEQGRIVFDGGVEEGIRYYLANHQQTDPAPS